MNKFTLTATLSVEATGDIDFAKARLISSLRKEKRSILGQGYSAKVMEVEINERRD